MRRLMKMKKMKITLAMGSMLCLVWAMALSACQKDECTGSCTGRECGDDGCGGTCGTCDSPPGACQADRGQCEAGGQCRYPELPDGTSCSDGLACNGEETCSGGGCSSGLPIICTPSAPCRISRCDGQLGGCAEVAVADGAACDDSDPCTTGETCQDSACVGGTDGCGQQVAVLFYVAGDNDLDEANLVCWRAMEDAGIDDTPWLRAFLLVDRAVGSIWTDTRLFELHNNRSQELPGPTLGLTLEGVEELNMGQPATLTGFIQDVRALVTPETNLFLVLLDHGDGWWYQVRAGGGAQASGGTHVPRGCCYDSTSGDDYLGEDELRQAVTGQNLTLIGWDACSMGMAEVAYEHRADAQVLVASPETEGLWGWDYLTLLRQFAQGQTEAERSAGRFAAIAMETYAAFSLQNQDTFATMSIYDTSAMEPLAQAATGMATALAGLDASRWQTLCNRLTWYGCDETGCYDHTDLTTLATEAKAIDPAHASAYDAVTAAVASAVIDYRAGTSHPDSQGMVVYFACQNAPWPEYGAIAWAQATGWYAMIQAHQ